MTGIRLPYPGVERRRFSEGQWACKNGVVVVHGDHNSFGIQVIGQRTSRILVVEVDWLGRRYKADAFDAVNLYRDCLDVDIRDCVVRVKEGDKVLVELGRQPQGHLYQPWMVWQGPQEYETDNGVSIPPALRIVDEEGKLWTLGFVTAEKEQSPNGEFAFNVIRDGLDVGEIASRIEYRSGQVRIFTRRGWKRWLGREFS